ncbi:hypothetical protein [Aeoliella mucimassa]|uniref:Uncharacterized protein n=1 Tax=Aeoliella mucimassa TaxID=2527972 RepID=A0A518AGV4_9BACT|nr:hypothetical protein [Aeoliella mucimassa]QDU53956.1 hypothetical protein Pan181_01350 [Aeoliella mucimassa]
MAEPATREEKILDAESSLKELAEIDANRLARTEDLSKSINFAESVPAFDEMLHICKELAGRDLKRLTSQQADRIRNACKTLQSLVDKVQTFDLNQDKPLDACNQIIQEIDTAYDSVAENLLLPLAFTATQATDFTKIEREAKGFHATMKSQSEDMQKSLNKVKHEAAQALEAVKEQAAEAGVSTSAVIFEQACASHKENAGKWFIATVAVLAMTLLASSGLLVISFYYTPTTVPEAIQFVVAKLFVLSTLSYGVFWCAKQYKAERHNQTVNQHRADALKTFRAFVEGSTDTQIRDAILVQAAQAAFIGRPTGYDGPDGDSPTIVPILEPLTRTVTKEIPAHS